MNKILAVTQDPNVHANPIILATFLTSIYDYKKMLVAKEGAKVLTRNKVLGKLYGERILEPVDRPDGKALLTRAYSLVEKHLDAKNPNLEMIITCLSIGIRMRYNRDVLSRSFQMFMNVLYKKITVYNKRKRKDPDAIFPIPKEIMCEAFTTAPHIGRYNEMVLIGSILETAYGEAPLYNIKYGNYPEGYTVPILEQLHDDASNNYSYDYSILYDMLNDPDNRDILEIQPHIAYFGDLIMDKYKVFNIKMKLIYDKEAFADSATNLYEESEMNSTMEGCINLEREFPPMTQWGDVMGWFNYHDGISLTGLSLPYPRDKLITKSMREVAFERIKNSIKEGAELEKEDVDENDLVELIVMKGKTVLDLDTERDLEEVAKRVTGYESIFIGKVVDDKESKEYFRQLKRTPTVHDSRYLVAFYEVEYRLQHKKGCLYTGRNIRTLTAYRDGEFDKDPVYRTRNEWSVEMHIELLPKEAGHVQGENYRRLMTYQGENASNESAHNK
ncbi:hypothetical protein AKO1_008137 [Acrasis kona]|uniref:Uncharacterized protein n=1 Tax=Acrasis kona TaxID=1008807 RepID=A0AAW2YN77_9EUKA